MTLFRLIKGDLLKSGERVILHQTNCTSPEAPGKGLAAAISSAYPYATPYTLRASTKQPDEPGTLRIYDDPLGRGPTFIGLFAQYGPGKPSRSRAVDDSAEQRLRWFVECLDLVASIPASDLGITDSNRLTRVAAPYTIGCGLAGGKWEDYERALLDWSLKRDIEVVLYVI
ncbi:hypothetical protein BT69DRAFT_1322791 [Atractiella rhizophila]|nr:hypothetical protein BT69DRAFT_1322791 [Atractiella rhizophila]